MKKKFLYSEQFIKDNMEEVLIQATSSIYQEAKEWYPKAHDKAVGFSQEFGKPVEVTSALISVLSPQKEWHNNLDLTEEFLRKKGSVCRHTKQQTEKAKLMYNVSGSREEIIASCEKYLGGLKTINFFRHILDPLEPNCAVLDTHMLQLMSGRMEYKDATPNQYNFLKNLLIKFAAEKGMIPSQLQSILWVTWKSIKPKRVPKEFVVEGEYF